VISLRQRVAAAQPAAEAAIEAPDARLTLTALARTTGLGAGRSEITGRSVLLRTRTQLGAAQGLVELDGLARRIVLCPPDVAPEHLPHVIAAAEVEAIVTDAPDEATEAFGAPAHRLAAPGEPVAAAPPSREATEWLMFTSGTSGAPKLVIHTLASLTGAIAPRATGAKAAVWGTFYDIRRYGGLQILLRALIGGCTLALCSPQEAPNEQLVRLGRLGVTHLTGTPSHWRRVLLSSNANAVAPAYVRLSGEIADQAVLDGLRAAFPNAVLVHAFASTEAGVAFEVTDGLEGFPEAFVGQPGPVAMKVVDGSLRIRSTRGASAYAGPSMPALVDDEGFIDTGDLVELNDGRWRFIGRRGGVINVGGLKVHPEEVEAVINRHPAVRLSRVRGRRNPIIGAIVSAEIALADPAAAASAEQEAALRESILDLCRRLLPAHKAPAIIRFVPGLTLTPAGKLDRADV
jgi:acyl-coenzyme A synthetase/AMP-(fatty) acid ligase